jgi:hypothetical protein
MSLWVVNRGINQDVNPKKRKNKDRQPESFERTSSNEMACLRPTAQTILDFSNNLQPRFYSKNSREANVIVGIDPGTTNSLIAIWEDGKPRLISNSLGEYLTPSCVSLDEDGTILVGAAARERLQTHPEKTASIFKRFMGSERSIKLGRKEFRVEELSALVLRSLKRSRLRPGNLPGGTKGRRILC